jgi:hypothetical protein
MGDGTVGQPYGVRHPMLEKTSMKSMEFASRGVESFADRFVVCEWITNEFSESLQEGAKREIPAIRDVQEYRQWASCFVKRRVQNEPEVTDWVRIKDPIIRTVEVAWTPEHLGHYLTVADEFAEWYKRQKESKVTNFHLLLARIGAVVGACNVPQRCGENHRVWTGGLTSKQVAVANLAAQYSKAGDKTVVFAMSPLHLECIGKELKRLNVGHMYFHGKIDSRKRNRELDERFRADDGDATVLLASIGTMQAGWDLYQANKVILASRDWSARTEEQAIRRTLRPQQTKDVEVTRFHLKGSIDEYQHQLVHWKSTAAASGLDWGEPMPDDVDFIHMDTLLGRFVEELALLRGIKSHDMRDQLKVAA